MNGQHLNSYTATARSNRARYERIAADIHREIYALSGDRYATPEELEMILTDPLGWYEMIEPEFTVATGRIIRFGKAILADEREMAQAQKAAAEGLAFRKARAAEQAPKVQPVAVIPNTAAIAAITNVHRPEPINVTTVAMLIGFDLVKTVEELPAGFRQNWNAAADAGYFTEAMTLGELRAAYCRYLARFDAERAAA